MDISVGESICVCMSVYTYVYGCESTIEMYAHMCIYVYIHIGAKTYLYGWPCVFWEGTANPA